MFWAETCKTILDGLLTCPWTSFGLGLDEVHNSGPTSRYALRFTSFDSFWTPHRFKVAWVTVPSLIITVVFSQDLYVNLGH